jgi:mannan endo-1,4-beta-mannosidase
MASPCASALSFLLLLLAAPALLPGSQQFAHTSNVPAAVTSPVLAWPPVPAPQPVSLDWLPINISATAPRRGPITHFIQRAGTQFVVASAANTPGAAPDSCDAFNFVGVNAFWLMLRAADPQGRSDVLHVLDSAAAMGLTVLRTWAFADGTATWRALQRSPGVYDESTFQGLDFVIHQAGLRGMRVLLAFGNAWQHYGGVDQYNQWSFEAGHGKCNGQLACRDDFWRDSYATGLYKNHIRAVLLRVNTFSGRVYRDDPTLFGFDLMNEPRSTADLYITQRKAATGPVYNLTFNNGSAAQDWIADVAAWTKAIDPVHLLTVGSEGFFGPSTPLYQYANPGPWASLLGVDFVANHHVKGIDFASTHIYVDQWFCTEKGATQAGQLGFFNDWVKAHIQAAEEELQMPLVLEEFGARLDTGQRAMLYQAAFDAFAASAQRRGAGGGVMFWCGPTPEGSLTAPRADLIPALRVLSTSGTCITRATRRWTCTAGGTATLCRQLPTTRRRCSAWLLPTRAASRTSTPRPGAPACASGRRQSRSAMAAAASRRACNSAQCPGHASPASPRM